MTFDSKNMLYATDKVKLDSGGAIAIALAKSVIINNVNTNEIIIGDARLTGVGSINISASSTANVQAQANSNTYGVAGAAQGESYSSVHADNRVTIGNNAEIDALGDISLNAGAGNNFYVKANTDLWNKTALPIDTDPKAHGENSQCNLVDIKSGAYIGSAADVHLNADKGYYYAYGAGVGTDLYREILAAIANFFGSIFGAKPVSLKIVKDSYKEAASADVRVDGTVRAGKKQYPELI
jgi:hypothetical protein